MSSSFRHIWTLFKKDVLLEIRQQYAFYGVLLYIGATIFVLYMAIENPDQETWNGLFWIIQLFISINAVAKSFFMKVDPAGKVLQISGLTEMANDMINGLQLDDNLRPMVQQAFTQQFNEENLKQMFKQAFEIYPDKPVSEGDTWSKTVSMKAIQMNSNTEYRVKSISNGTVLIDASSDLDMSGFKGTENASFEVDAATGLVRKSTSTQKFDEPMKMTTVTKIKGEER